LKTCVWFQSAITLMGGRTPSRKVSKHFPAVVLSMAGASEGGIGVPESQGRETQMSARIADFYTL
jgi:hypothetical protein